MYQPLPANHPCAFLGMSDGPSGNCVLEHNSDSSTGFAGQAGAQHG